MDVEGIFEAFRGKVDDLDFDCKQFRDKYDPAEIDGDDFTCGSEEMAKWKDLLAKMNQAEASDRAVAKIIARLATEYRLSIKEMAKFYNNLREVKK